jgi:general nucleoside transport system permease protein
MTQAATKRTLPPWWDAVTGRLLALVGAFAFAGIIGSIIIVAYGEDPLNIYRTIWVFSTSEFSDVARVLEIATPLIFSGLAVAVAFKAGMFNIGVEGQYIVAMAAAAAVATGLEGPPTFILLPLVILGAMLAGMLWAAIPGILKVKTGAHEVVTTIMMNGIAISLVAWLLRNFLKTQEEGLIDLRTDLFPEEAKVQPLFGSLPASVNLTWFFPLALIACAIVWFLLYRTRLGYSTRAVGASAGSAEAGGISIGGTQFKVFLISGALAGLVGLNYILGDRGFLASNYVQGLGFTGIGVAFLGRNHPVGIALSAILLGMLFRGQDGVAVTTDLPTEVLIILQGLLILSVVIAYALAQRFITARSKKRIAAESDEEVRV